MTLKIKPTILYDSREKTQYKFTSYVTKKTTLKTGDYSILGHENNICVERKTHADIYGTLSSKNRRNSFKKEFQRMSLMDTAVVVIECTYEQLQVPPRQSRMSAISLIGTLSVWGRADCFNVPVLLVGNRESGEKKCLEILMGYWDKL